MEDAPQSDAGHAPLAEASVAGTFSELDQWVAAEGIFLHPDDYRIDEKA